MKKLYDKCTICPHQCGINRNSGQLGRCQAPPRPKIAKIMLHPWEEPCLSGNQGSGAIFFSHCNLNCIFCQNHPISQAGNGSEITESELAAEFITLQRKGAHNINLVSPTPYLPSIITALQNAKQNGLNIPVVYNTNAYESPESIDLLDGLVDIYLPDLKFYSTGLARELTQAPDYFPKATEAILRMFAQTGPTRMNSEGMMTKGILIRHLVLPGYLEESRSVLRWIRSHLSKDVYLSLMSQYFPAHRAPGHPVLNRTLRPEEYEEIIDYFLELDLENGFIQDISSASETYVPEFE